MQPCFSPVWDTALALNALADGRRRPAHDPAVAQGGAAGCSTAKSAGRATGA